MNKSPFNSILCLNGGTIERDLLNAYNALPIYAADGAYNTLLDIGVKPDVVVGDFDSINHMHTLDKEITFIETPDQNCTDFEKTLFEIKKKKLYPTLVLGALGKEIDHTINNLHTVIKYGKECPMVLYDQGEKPKWMVPLYKSLSFKAIRGDMISLLPYPEAIVTTAGLKWDLHNAKLSIMGHSRARNQITDSTVNIAIQEGSLFMVTNRLCLEYD